MKTIKFLAAMLVVASVMMSCNGQGKGGVKAELPKKGEIDSVSYLVGVNFGMMIKGQIADEISDLNMSELRKGMEDALKAEDPKGYGDTNYVKQFKINLDDANRIISGLINKRMAYKAEVSLNEGRDFLKANAKKEGVDTTASGLQYRIENAGGEYKVMPKDTVEVKYKGTLLDGTVFDETTGDETRTFNADRVIKGWTEGLGLWAFALPALVTLVGGFIIFNPFAESVMSTVAGASLIVYGASELFSSWKMKKAIDEYEIHQTRPDDTRDDSGDDLMDDVKDVDYEKVDEQ